MGAVAEKLDSPVHNERMAAHWSVAHGAFDEDRRREGRAVIVVIERPSRARAFTRLYLVRAVTTGTPEHQSTASRSSKNTVGGHGYAFLMRMKKAAIAARMIENQF